MEITFDINLKCKLRLLYDKRRYGTKEKPKEPTDSVEYLLFLMILVPKCVKIKL
jgi:hypothetical protein